MDPKIEVELSKLRQKLIEIKARISQCRKKGINPKLVELRITNIPSKIKYAEVTEDFKDVEKINALVIEAEAEIKYTEENKMKDGE